MSDIIATSTDRMKDDIESLDSQLSAMETAFNEAWEAVAALNATWVGAAHDTLVAEFQADQATMEALLANLRKYRDELEANRKEYSACEWNVSSLINSMKI